MVRPILHIILSLSLFASCANKTVDQSIPSISTSANDTAIFANGCFWCTEAIFSQLKGVEKVVSGYTGGKTLHPTYASVSTGNTGHAECLQIIFDSTVISYDELLEVFWETHDPTTLNRQGADVGTQYRSAIFFRNQSQFEKAFRYKTLLNEENVFGKPVVTEITPFQTFYAAEEEHKDYYQRNKNAPYCRVVITPKIEKFRKVFKSKLKE